MGFLLLSTFGYLRNVECGCRICVIAFSSPVRSLLSSDYLTLAIQTPISLSVICFFFLFFISLILVSNRVLVDELHPPATDEVILENVGMFFALDQCNDQNVQCPLS